MTSKLIIAGLLGISITIFGTVYEIPMTYQVIACIAAGIYMGRPEPKVETKGDKS